MANSTSAVDSANGLSMREEGHPDAVDETVPALLVPQNEIDTDGGKKRCALLKLLRSLSVTRAGVSPLEVVPQCKVEKKKFSLRCVREMEGVTWKYQSISPEESESALCI
ncbi:hypothetical protein IW261DRAFT_1426004 [Armillaria novae-zelandiae]|uniref:Uncharacterized protein n=1 Tax=Armillaria novae-zelandiae TaxID=153914 RepID=A0AA39NP29_9AGAR|nr:hypothetical protein IW261DRAFT_1426004 [Armillaria novae-zelandiae]